MKKKIFFSTLVMVLVVLCVSCTTDSYMVGKNIKVTHTKGCQYRGQHFGGAQHPTKGGVMAMRKR